LLQFFKKYLDKSHKKDDTDWKGYNVYPLRGAIQLRKLQKEVTRSMPKVTQPTLIVISKADKTVSLETGEKIFGSISSQQKELIVMENSPHVMLLGNESEQVFAYAERFFNHNSVSLS
jgi:carboxylesterase